MNWFVIVLFIISIILFLLTKYYRLKKDYAYESLEEFENKANLTPTEILFNTHNIKINYITAKYAKNLIHKDGEYLQGMNQANLSARNCENIDELYSKYLDGFDDITNDDKHIIDSFILNLIINIKNNNESYYKYIVKWLQTINIAKAKPWLEDGMPHTLDNTIIMDANWFSKPRKTTFIHEITHVHQRLYPTEFEDLYPMLGYLYNPIDIKGLYSIYPLNRNNPDGASKYWLWGDNTTNTTTNFQTSYWWIGAIFKSVTPIKLTDVDMLALKLDKGEDGIFYYLKQNPTPLKKLTNFVNFFGENPNNYHPNEMTAKFAEWYLTEILKNDEDLLNDSSNTRHNYNNFEGYIIYKKYIEKLINTYY